MPGSYTPPVSQAAIRRRTTNYNLLVPEFDAPGWGKALESDLDVLDAVLYAFTGISGVIGAWDNSTAFTEGMRAVDTTDSSLWQCLVDHISPASGSFEDSRTADPLFWRLLTTGAIPRGDWATTTNYNAGEFVTDSGRTGIVVQTYISGASYDADVADDNIITIVDVSAFTAYNITILAAAAKNVLADDDVFSLLDSAAANAVKQITWENIITNILAVTDPLYLSGGTFQPLDADLTAIAALTTTAFGRAFLALADEAAFKASMNLEAGVDYQAYSAKLAAYASGDIPSAFFLGLVDGADAATWFTALKQAATTTATGVAELATGAETATQSDADRVVTPLGLNSVVRTLAEFYPSDNEFFGTNFATFNTRNAHPILEFDTTTQEIAIFTGTLPYWYKTSGSIVVEVSVALASATTGTVGFDVAFERMDTGLDLDADSFASAKTITATTVPGTSGQQLRLTVTHSSSEIDGLVAGEQFRLRLRRDVTNDTAAGDAQVTKVELRNA